MSSAIKPKRYFEIENPNTVSIKDIVDESNWPLVYSSWINNASGLSISHTESPIAVRNTMLATRILLTDRIFITRFCLLLSIVIISRIVISYRPHLPGSFHQRLSLFSAVRFFLY